MQMVVKLILIQLFRGVSRLLRFIPLKNNQILFYSFSGKQYSDSPMYISDYINAHPMRQNLILLWGVNNPERYRTYETDNLRFIKYKSFHFMFEYLRSGFIVTNMGPIRAIARRTHQEIIDTWHGGGAYKKAGTAPKHKTRIQIIYSGIAMKDVTLFLSSSEAFTRVCIQDAHHYTGETLNVGLPRNDILFNYERHGLIKEKVKRSFGISQDTHIVLYAPTWKNYDTSDYESLNCEHLLEVLHTRFDGKWILLYRMHNLMSSSFAQGTNEYFFDATAYSDMQELLIAADVLITDYSSSIWDFSFLRRPAFLFVPDLDFYEKQFGFCSPITTWGFAVCKSNHDLEQSIADYDSDRQIKAIVDNHVAFGSYETGEACRRVYEFIENKLQ